MNTNNTPKYTYIDIDEIILKLEHSNNHISIKVTQDGLLIDDIFKQVLKNSDMIQRIDIIGDGISWIKPHYVFINHTYHLDEASIENYLINNNIVLNLDNVNKSVLISSFAYGVERYDDIVLLKNKSRKDLKISSLAPLISMTDMNNRKENNILEASFRYVNNDRTEERILKYKEWRFLDPSRFALSIT